MGKLLVIVGAVVMGVGLLVMMGLPIGRLPGDFTIKRGNATFYFPLATSILASIILTLLLSLLRR
jgi:NADH:ubiquinone oxidoreductase subunit 6 (subunit J)